MAPNRQRWIVTLQNSPAAPLLLPRSPGRALKWTIAATCLAAYVLLTWISLIHVHKGVPVTPWDPGLGVVFALMAFAGPRAGFVLFGGVVIAGVLLLQHEVEWRIIIGMASITSLSYTAVTNLAVRAFPNA